MTAGVDTLDREILLLDEEVTDRIDEGTDRIDEGKDGGSLLVEDLQQPQPGDQYYHQKQQPQLEPQLQELNADQQEKQDSNNPKPIDRLRPHLKEKVGSLGRHLKQRFLQHSWGKKDYNQLC